MRQSIRMRRKDVERKLEETEISHAHRIKCEE